MPLPVPLRFLGSPGSPYTKKMVAVLRYRRIPYCWIVGGHQANRELPRPKVQLLPTFYLPDTDGRVEAVVDSTPLIRRFEQDFPQRKVIPTDPALNFLDFLLEDYADEWLTKAMFHYRWHFAADIAKAREILPRWTARPMAEEALAPVKAMIGDRQINRLYVVGSNATTASVIEQSYVRYLALLRKHLELHPFLLGARPSASDFAAYGQLTQLAHFDPTPMQLTLSDAPRVYAWVDVVDDLSGLEPVEADWFPRDRIPDTVKALLAEVGRCYVPVMLANANAIASQIDSVRTEIDGLPWVQEPFPYQAKCVQWIGERYAGLDDEARRTVDNILSGTGCERLVAPFRP